MDLTALECFMTVYEYKNMSKAAEVLFLSRQSVSHTLQQLEKELGVTLVERKRDGIDVTPAGVYFYHQARQILSIWKETKQRLASSGTQYRKKLTVGFGQASYHFWAGKPILEMADQFPELEIIVQTMSGNELYDGLVNRQIDLAVSNSPFQNDKLATRVLKRMPLYCVLHEDDRLNEKHILHLSDLEGRVIMLVKKNDSFLALLKRTVEERQIQCSFHLLHSFDILSIFRELSRMDDCVHITADFFSDMLPQNVPFTLKKLDTNTSVLNKDIKAFFWKSDIDDRVIQEYIRLLRRLIHDSKGPNSPAPSANAPISF